MLKVFQMKEGLIVAVINENGTVKNIVSYTIECTGHKQLNQLNFPP